MSEFRHEAVAVANRLHQEDRIDYGDYSALIDGLAEIDTLRDRDEELEELWAELSDVAIDPETERTEEPFLHFPVGTDREDIWHWFDERHSKGVAYLLYGGTEDYVPEARRLYALKKLCTECDSESCVFNPHGVCLAPFVTGHAPALCDEGCGDYCYKEV